MATNDKTNPWPRYANAALGAWLALSAFLWSHMDAQFTNALLVGVLAAVVALVATRREQVRYLNAALAVWLFASIWVLPGAYEPTAWNHALVALGMLAMAMLPGSATARSTTGTRRSVGRTHTDRPATNRRVTTRPADSIV